MTASNLAALDTLKNENLVKESFFRIVGLRQLDIYGNIYKELLAKERQAREITYEEKYEDFTKFNYIKELGGDGMEMINQQILENQNRVFSYMVSQLGKNFMKGKNLLRIPMPLYVNDKRTALQL